MNKPIPKAQLGETAIQTLARICPDVKGVKPEFYLRPRGKTKLCVMPAICVENNFPMALVMIISFSPKNAHILHIFGHN